MFLPCASYTNNRAAITRAPKSLYTTDPAAFHAFSAESLRIIPTPWEPLLHVTSSGSSPASKIFDCSYVNAFTPSLHVSWIQAAKMFLDLIALKISSILSSDLSPLRL